MTTVLALMALNAANFESGNASDGQVLTADGAGGAAFEDAAGGELTSVRPVSGMQISGATQETVNAFFPESVIVGGKPSYVKDNVMVIWTKGAWIIIQDSVTMLYLSMDDVATPDLVSTWFDGSMALFPSLVVVPFVGVAPAPTGYVPSSDGASGILWKNIVGLPDPTGTVDGSVLTVNNNIPSWQTPAGGVLPTIPNGQLVVSGAGTNGANRSFALMQELVNGYPAWDGGGYRVTRETYPDMRWCIYWPGDELPMYGSNDPVETPDLVTDWAAVLGENPPPSSVVILPAPALANTIPVSDGTGDVTWQNQPIGVPSVVGASEGDTLTINNGVASWQAPAGGGASFAWDGAEIVATVDSENANLLGITVQLKNGEADFVGVASTVCVAQTGDGEIASYSWSLTSLTFTPPADAFGRNWQMLVFGGGYFSATLQFTGGNSMEGANAGYIRLLLPSGAFADSNLIDGWITTD